MKARVARGMIDTPTVILLGGLVDLSVLSEECVISAVTLAELSVGSHVAGTGRERSARRAHLQQAEANFQTLPFDAASARAFGRVAASLRQAGRKPAARAYDALIAASAIATICCCIPATRPISPASTSYRSGRFRILATVSC